MGRRAESAGVAVAAVWPLRAQTNGQGKSANLRQCHPVVRRLGYGLNLAAYGGAGVRTKFVLGGQNGADQRRCAGDAARSEIASAKRFKYTMTPVVDAPCFCLSQCKSKLPDEGGAGRTFTRLGVRRHTHGAIEGGDGPVCAITYILSLNTVPSPSAPPYGVVPYKIFPTIVGPSTGYAPSLATLPKL